MNDSRLNDLDGKINDRGFFERILKEFKETLVERNLRLDERFAAQEKAILKAENRLDSTMKGFPQEYARKTEMEQMRIDLASTAGTLAEKVTDSAAALASAHDKVAERQESRISALEKFQSKLLGIALLAPLVVGVVTGLLTWAVTNK